MKISTKGRYGLIAMVDLAIHCKNGELVSLNSICKRQNMSQNYLEHVLAPLRKSGLVKGIKGSQGGYTLAYEPKNIKIGDILRVLEGNLFEVSGEEITNNDKNVEKAIENTVWNGLDECINKFVDSITLDDLMKEYDALNSNNFMFYI